MFSVVGIVTFFLSSATSTSVRADADFSYLIERYLFYRLFRKSERTKRELSLVGRIRRFRTLSARVGYTQN